MQRGITIAWTRTITARMKKQPQLVNLDNIENKEKKSSKIVVDSV